MTQIKARDGIAASILHYHPFVASHSQSPLSGKALNAPPQLESIDLAIEGMTCAACAARIEKALKRIDGVDAAVNLASERAHVRYPQHLVSVEQLVGAIEKAGYGGRVASREGLTGERARKQAHYDADLRTFWIAALLTLPLLAQMVPMAFGVHDDLLPRWLQWLLATPVQFWVGKRFYVGAWHSVRGGSANMDVLVALGTTTAYALSVYTTVFGGPGGHVYFEAAAVIVTLVLLGKILESRAKARTTAAIDALVNLQPKQAHVERNNAWIDVDVEQVRRGDVLLVRPGESLPVDAEVIDGQSHVVEAMLTGESIPVSKGPGARVYAATLNQEGALRCRATGVGADTALARIIRLVEAAQGSKAAVQRLADRVAAVFVPAVLAIALVTLLGWLLVGASVETAVVNAVAVLVISCPCALGLATPTAIMVGIGRGAQSGILIKDATALEQACELRALVFDKTGTLTEGKPAVTDVVPVADLVATEVIRLAASIEQGSEHPLARAIVRHAVEQQLTLLPLARLAAAAGQGVSGEIASVNPPGIKRYLVGSPAYLAASGLTYAPDQVEALRAQGKTVIGLAALSPGVTPESATESSRVLGWIAVADRLRTSSPEAVRRLRELGIRTVMLTGDNSATAATIAQACGIDEFQAEVMPAGKAERVAQLKASGHKVGMAGDGVNDAPALAAADVGFAMGAGSDVAMQTAGVLLMHSDLVSVVDAIDLSRATLRKVKQNLFFAFVYNVLGIPLAAMGVLSPMLAGAAMAASSVSVVTNSLALRRWKPGTSRAAP